jgi:hypothetical protein
VEAAIAHGEGLLQVVLIPDAPSFSGDELYQAACTILCKFIISTCAIESMCTRVAGSVNVCGGYWDNTRRLQTTEHEVELYYA